MVLIAQKKLFKTSKIYIIGTIILPYNSSRKIRDGGEVCTVDTVVIKMNNEEMSVEEINRLLEAIFADEEIDLTL